LFPALDDGGGPELLLPLPLPLPLPDDLEPEPELGGPELLSFNNYCPPEDGGAEFHSGAFHSSSLFPALDDGGGPELLLPLPLPLPLPDDLEPEPELGGPELFSFNNYGLPEDGGAEFHSGAFHSSSLFPLEGGALEDGGGPELLLPLPLPLDPLPEDGGPDLDLAFTKTLSGFLKV